LAQGYNENNNCYNHVLQIYNHLFSRSAFKHYLNDFMLDLKIKTYSLEEAKEKYYKIISYYFKVHESSVQDATYALQGLDKNYLFTIAISSESKERFGEHIYPNQVCAFVDKRFNDKRKADADATRITVTVNSCAVGKYYKVFKEDEAKTFSKGSIIKLTKIDGTWHPGFALVKGYCKYKDISTHVFFGLGYIEEIDYNPTEELNMGETPFERAGYTKNDRFITDEYPGNIYKIRRDDDSTCPYFKCEKSGEENCIYIEELQKLETTTQPTQQSKTNPDGETPMNPSQIIQTQINVFNRNAAEMSDDELFGTIREVEAAIDHLKETKVKSVKLEAKVTEMEAQLKALVTYLDNRD